MIHAAAGRRVFARALGNRVGHAQPVASRRVDQCVVPSVGGFRVQLEIRAVAAAAVCRECPGCRGLFADLARLFYEPCFTIGPSS